MPHVGLSAQVFSAQEEGVKKGKTVCVDSSKRDAKRRKQNEEGLAKATEAEMIEASQSAGSPGDDSEANNASIVKGGLIVEKKRSYVMGGRRDMSYETIPFPWLIYTRIITCQNPSSSKVLDFSCLPLPCLHCCHDHRSKRWLLWQLAPSWPGSYKSSTRRWGR